MDLDGFEQTRREELTPHNNSSFESTHAALQYFDDTWFIAANRRARWMDLIGDYAGSEHFVIDGESLFQEILDDPLLALGRRNDHSFQLLHAIHSLERMLSEFLQRSAVFEIFFWQSSRHLTLQTGGPKSVFASRSLARAILFKHLQGLGLTVRVFEHTADPEWLRYIGVNKPMFIMLNDGGHAKAVDSALVVERILLQRIMMFDFISQGVSLSLLRGSEFRDSKILSFVFEQRLDPKAREQLDQHFWIMATRALDVLNYQDSTARGVLPTALSANLAAQENWGIDELMEQYIGLLSRSLGLQQRFMPEILFAFVAHCFLVPTLGVEARARPLQKLHTKLDTLIHSFLQTTFLALEALQPIHAVIDIDGRIFVALLRFLLQNPSLSPRHTLGNEIYGQANALWIGLALPVVNYAAMATHFPVPCPTAPHISPATSASDAFGVLPFANPVFDDALASVRVDVREQEDITVSAESQLEFNVSFVDGHHWHNHRRAILPKHLGGEDIRPTDERQRRRQLRGDQRFMAKLEWQAQTLLGAVGTPLKRITVANGGTPRSDTSKARNRADSGTIERGQVSKPPKKEKAGHMTAADRIRKENADKKRKEQDDSNRSWWTDQLRSMKHQSTRQQVTRVDSLGRNEKRSAEGWLAVEMRLYRLHLEFARWIEDPDHESDDVEKVGHTRDRFAVPIMRMVKEIYERGGLFLAAFDVLSSVLVALGFSAYESSLRIDSPNQSNDDAGKRLSFDFVKLIRSRSKKPVHKFMHIAEDPIVWQLRLFGEFMDRSMDSQTDCRVSFKPDAWQRQVLDSLDKHQSVLVVAPTSAGKTFISYYAMEKVLRANDDDILVYVAPTKALVSQIAAEVYARFSKVFKAAGRSCWAIHTRDYRIHNPQNCQILITVPEVLAKMLLSPPLARVWTPKLKRIILDEIHTIGQQEGGAVWEQILLLAPCPIIGLSATIGHPEKFNAWLESVQRAHGFEHMFIHHPHRYSHLRKFNYVLQTKPGHSFNGLDTYEVSERLRFLHPVSLLSSGARSLPPDLSLEAADCLSLYKALDSLRNSTSSVALKALEPTKCFPRDVLLRQKDILAYENELKERLCDVIGSSDPQDESSTLNKLVSKLADPMISQMPSLVQNTPPSSAEFFCNLLYLICDLHAQGDLPALLFQFDRGACEKMTECLLQMLEKAEQTWRESSPEWAMKIRRWNLWNEKAKDREREADRLKKREKRVDAQDAEVRVSWESSFDPNDPSPQFSLAGNPAVYNKARLEDDIADLKWRRSAPEWVLVALRRGIGIHHSGMNKHYRTLVESLYRIGYLRVIVCTGTLALGINAPTKTTVFCGDSPYLTALMYRQCAGRAGRRGFDLLGKVVFYGIAMDRAQRLVLSKLPSLGGNFPLTTTMVLRLFNLLQGSDYAPEAVKAIQSLVGLPQVSYVSHTGQHQIQHHIRFSIDYLRRSGLLDAAGNPMNLFAIAAHLYYTEPSNFAMVMLLRSGVVHDICNRSDKVSAKKDFLTLMCHLFGRRYLPKAYTTSTHIKTLIKKSASMVILPPMPHKARKLLQEHDAEILRVFTGYALAFAEQYGNDLGPDCQLPISQKSYSADEDDTSSSPFREYLRSTAIQVAARSPFVANSGHGDEFGSIAELTHTTRQGLHLNDHAIPSMQHIVALPGDGDRTYALNAYLLDYYIHGQVQALVASNGLRRGDLWYLLQDFTLTLKTVRESLEQLLLRASTSALSTGEEEADLDDHFETADPAEIDSDGGLQNPDSAQQPKGPGGTSSLQRPTGVSDRDWRVFEIVNEVTNEFEERFRAMWA